MHRIQRIFSVDDVERLEKFDTFHLEWLAIFLSIPDWRPKSNSTETFDEEDAHLRKAPFYSTRIAMDNLRSHLGVAMSSSTSNPFFSDSLSCFPLLKTTLQRSAWKNRNVVEASVHIDNMLALSAGGHYNFMDETKKRISNAFGEDRNI